MPPPSPEARRLNDERSLLHDVSVWAMYAPHLVKLIGTLREADDRARIFGVGKLLGEEPDVIEYFHEISSRITTALALRHPSLPCGGFLEIAAQVERFYRFDDVAGMTAHHDLVIAYNHAAGMVN